MGICTSSAAMIRNATNVVSLVMLHRKASPAHFARGVGIQRMYVTTNYNRKKKKNQATKLKEKKILKKKIK